MDGMDWATLIVGILSFVGIVAGFFVTNYLTRKTIESEKEKVNDSYAREIVTKSRKEWMLNFKSDMAKYLSYYELINNVNFIKSLEVKKQELSEIYNKIKFYLNPIDPIDDVLFQMVENSFIKFNELDINKLASEDEYRNKIKEEFHKTAKTIRDFITCMFKVEWERIKYYAYHGDDNSFEYSKKFYDLYEKVQKGEFDMDSK